MSSLLPNCSRPLDLLRSRRQAGHRWLQLTFLLWLRALTAVSALKTNFTVEDDDPSIVYLPESAWTQIQWSGAFRDSPMAGDGSARMAHTGSDPTIENWWKIRMDSLQRESSTSIAEYGSGAFYKSIVTWSDISRCMNVMQRHRPSDILQYL